MDEDEKTLLAESLDRLVGDTAPEVLHGSLEEFGWRELLADEPRAATTVLCGLQGKHLAATGVLDTVASRAAGFEDAAVAYPDLASGAPTSRVQRGTDRVRISAVVSAGKAPLRLLVPALLDDDVVLVHAEWQGDWPGSGVSIDPEAGFAVLRTTLRGELITEDAAARWERLRAAGHRALAHELVAVGQHMLELALEHVTSREQFGRTLGGFQAVKHKLADVRLCQETAGFAASAAWEATEHDEQVDAALLAKVAANRFCGLAREHCQQVLGGMGFTWEHGFHRYARRALLLEPLLGDTNALHTLLGDRIKSTGALPRLAPL